MTSLRIIDLAASDAERVTQTATLLHVSFLSRGTTWSDLDSAHAEVLSSLEPEKISRVALDDAGHVIGWIGGQPLYDGLVWEVHPIVVSERARRRGIGRALIEDLERLVGARGAMTLWLGSDDEVGETSLADADLYADLPAHLGRFRASGQHPFPFFTRLGFHIVGVLPDANGRGRPDIFFAKRVGS
jgi:aminoglycoside 6'-N-acetyltransferase I